MVSAGALAEYLTYNYDIKFILLHFVLGIMVGILGNSLLISINSAAPDFTSKLVSVLSNGILEVIKEIPKLAVKKLEDLFQWLKVITRKDKDE